MFSDGTILLLLFLTFKGIPNVSDKYVKYKAFSINTLSYTGDVAALKG